MNAKGGYLRDSGTSMASPQVAGAAALVKQAYPYFTAHNLQQTILITATSLGDPNVYGWGLLNVGKAVRGPAQFVDTFDVDTQGYNSTFYNDISGTGQLVKRGAGQLTLAGANTYTGLTQVQSGKLVISGSQASTVQVAAASTLGGSGRVGGLDNAGTITPGNRVGVLTVNGDYVSQPGSVYQVEANASGNDQIRVSGTAKLNGGTVQVQVNELFSVGKLYPIVTADAGIVGRFEGVTTEQGMVFLRPALNYTQPGTLQLAIARSDVTFVQYLSTSNQKAAGNAMDAVSGAPPAGLRPLYDLILNGTSDTLAANMDQVSGELHASTQSALLNASGLVQRTLGQRLRGNLGAGLVAGAPTAQASGLIPVGALPTSSAYPLWASVVGNWTTLKDNGNAAQVKTDTAGLFVGGDTTVGDGWWLGAALGYTEGRISMDDRSSRSNVKSYTGALYGGRSWATSQASNLAFTISGAPIAKDAAVVDLGAQVALGKRAALGLSYSAQFGKGSVDNSGSLYLRVRF